MAKERFSYWKTHTLLTVVVIVIVAMAAIWIFKGPIIATYLSSKLKVAVSLKSINITKSHMHISNFTIKNPWGYSSSYAFRGNNIDVNYNWSQLTNNPSYIDDIQIEGIYLNVDCNNVTCSKNNWTDILSKFEKKKQKASAREVIIRNLTLRNMTVEVFGMGLDSNSKNIIHIDSMHFSNISSKKGFPTDELIYEIFKRAGLNQYIQDILKATKHLQDFLTPFFSEGERQEKEDLDKVSVENL